MFREVPSYSLNMKKHRNALPVQETKKKKLAFQVPRIQFASQYLGSLHSKECLQLIFWWIIAFGRSNRGCDEQIATRIKKTEEEVE